METIEQKSKRETLIRFNKIRRGFTVKKIAEAYGCSKQNIDKRVEKLKSGTITEKGMRKLNKALDEIENENN